MANDPTTTPDPGGRLEGTFIGTVEPSGLIQLNDLNSFTALYVDFAAPGGFVNMGLGDLTLFSFDVGGGSSTLDFAGIVACVGAAVGLDGDCNANFTLTYQPGANGAVFLSGFSVPLDSTTDLPIVTFVSNKCYTNSLPASLPLFASSVALLSLVRLAQEAKERSSHE